MELESSIIHAIPSLGFLFPTTSKRRHPIKKKKVLSSRSTSFPRHWKSRPAQRMALFSPSFRQQRSQNLSHSFFAEPPLFAIRSTTSASQYSLRLLWNSIKKKEIALSLWFCRPAPGEFTRPILQSPAQKKSVCDSVWGPLSLLSTLRSHGSQSRGGRVGCRYHEPSVPHIYPEASVVHRFHRMLLSLGKDRVSVQLCFGCFAIE